MMDYFNEAKAHKETINALKQDVAILNDKLKE